MSVKLTTTWISFSEYRGWTLEYSKEVDPDTFDKITGSMHRARRHRFVMYSDNGLERNKASLDMIRAIDILETAHKDKLKKERLHMRFDTPEDARDYAERRIYVTEQKRLRLYVGIDQWEFRESHGKIIGGITRRNAL